MFCHSFVPTLALASLATAGFAEPTVRECRDAAAAFSEMLDPKTKVEDHGIGWVLLPPAADYDALDREEQWKQVAGRLGNYKVLLFAAPLNRPPLMRNGTWADETGPEDRWGYARGFTVLDTLEQCLRPLVSASSSALTTEIAELDSRLSPETRADLRPLMKASQ